MGDHNGAHIKTTKGRSVDSMPVIFFLPPPELTMS
jgi:hypothetical protein